MERSPERVEAEITLPMITMRNFNLVAGSEVPIMRESQSYVVGRLLKQPKQPDSSRVLAKEESKGKHDVIC